MYYVNLRVDIRRMFWYIVEFMSILVIRDNINEPIVYLLLQHKYYIYRINSAINLISKLITIENFGGMNHKT